MILNLLKNHSFFCSLRQKFHSSRNDFELCRRRLLSEIKGKKKFFSFRNPFNLECRRYSHHMHEHFSKLKISQVSYCWMNLFAFFVSFILFIICFIHYWNLKNVYFLFFSSFSYKKMESSIKTGAQFLI